MDNTTTFTAAQILDGLAATQRNLHGNAGPTPPANALSAVAAQPAAVAPALLGGTIWQRRRYEKELTKAIEQNLPVVIGAQAAVVTTRMLDQIDAVSDQVKYHIFLRKSEHNQRLAAAGQVHDEKLAEVHHRSENRWIKAAADRIVEFKSMFDQGLITEAELRRRVDKSRAFFERMEGRTDHRIDGIRDVTDGLVGFGNNNRNNPQ